MVIVFVGLVVIVACLWGRAASDPRSYSLTVAAAATAVGLAIGIAMLTGDDPAGHDPVRKRCDLASGVLVRDIDTDLMLCMQKPDKK